MTGTREVTASRIEAVSTGAFVALGIVAVAVAAWSLANGGIGWDARFDTTTSLEVRAVDPSWTLEDAYESVTGPSEYYGVLVQQAADLLHRLGGGSGRLQPDDPGTYAYQGAVTLLLSVLAATALAGALGVALRSWSAAALTWSLTLSTPLWLGMSHVDVKDVPVAAGVTLTTAGLILSLSLRSAGRATFAGVALAGAGAAVALATRAGSAAVLAALVGGTVLVAVGVRAHAHWRGRSSPVQLAPVLTTAGLSVVYALGVLWATNPIARIDLLTWLRDSIEVASSFPSVLMVRTAGRDLSSNDLPWWYVPSWLGAQLPVLTIALLLVSVAALVVMAVRGHRPSGVAAAAIVPVLLQGIVIPIAVIARDPVLYDGIRHLLFMLPALLALPGIALAAAGRTVGLAGRTGVAVSASLVVVVGASLAAAIQWAPYAYAHLNPVAGRAKAPASWELDYWGVSGREGVTRLRDLGLGPIEVEPANDVGIPWGAEPDGVADGAERAVYVFRRGSAAVAADCVVVFTIERGGHVLGEGARCPAPD